jgi:hypothetical protein
VRAPKPSSVPELRLFCERPRRSPLSTKDARCGESREHTSIRPVPCPFQHGRGSGTLVRCCHSNGDAACVLSLEPKVGQKFRRWISPPRTEKPRFRGFSSSGGRI